MVYVTIHRATIFRKTLAVLLEFKFRGGLVWRFPWCLSCMDLRCTLCGYSSWPMKEYCTACMHGLQASCMAPAAEGEWHFLFRLWIPHDNMRYLPPAALTVALMNLPDIVLPLFECPTVRGLYK